MRPQTFLVLRTCFGGGISMGNILGLYLAICVKSDVMARIGIFMTLSKTPR